MIVNNYQVFQRGSDGNAEIALPTGGLATLPTGGPFEVGTAKDIFVGDLWLLAGQSNMEGCGALTNTETPDARVHSYQSREQWSVAEEPLHWLGESPHVVHHKLQGREAVPDTLEARDLGRAYGAGLGLTFAKERLAHTDVPVGLIPAAHGGTSMEQWDPKRRGEGGASLYGAALARVRANGGKLAGILWYQGESDCYADALALYPQRMTELVQAFREDCGQADLPFYVVQIGCFVTEPTPDGIGGWNGIREAQRIWAGTQANVFLVSAIDLGLDDGIHIGTPGLKRLGRRLARVAGGSLAPNLHGVSLAPDGLSVRVSFDHVRGGLMSQGRPAGFSLRTSMGQELVCIYKITLEGDSAVLHLTEALPAGTNLWYGWGLNPYCNVTDAEDAAIPAFGPSLFLRPTACLQLY